MSTGLFLTPGAARAAYQVGAVQELVHAGLRFDVVAASSVGALNAAFVATGQVDRLAELWGQWRTSDIMGLDLPEILRGRLFWARNLMHNRPQKTQVIDRYLAGTPLLPGVRLRINLANLSRGDQDVVEWPAGSMPLAEGVNASVAVPGAIRPVEHDGDQLADGLTVDGFPLERLLLETGVDTAYVVGVSPRRPIDRPVTGPYQTLLRAVEWNQYTETTLGLERAERRNDLIRHWARDRRAAEQAVTELTADNHALCVRLLAEIAKTYQQAGFPYTRAPVKMVSILPEQEIRMFFTAYHPQRSRRLLAQGRRDARAVLEEYRP